MKRVQQRADLRGVAFDARAHVFRRRLTAHVEETLSRRRLTAFLGDNARAGARAKTEGLVVCGGA